MQRLGTPVRWYKEFISEAKSMAQLSGGDQLPEISLNTNQTNDLSLPGAIESNFAIILFYRGHWWPFCRRLLDGFEARLNQFTELGVKIYAASSDPQDKAQEVGASLSFPIGWGVERDLGDTIGVFWDERRNHIQPSEFLINRKGRILSSTYSSSPVGRMDPQETLTLMGYLVPK